jgi:hypothetical protein
MKIILIVSILIFLGIILYKLVPTFSPTPNPPTPNPPTPNPPTPNPPTPNTYDMKVGYLGDYYIDIPLKNDTYTVLADTGSCPFVMDINEYNTTNLQKTNGPMDVISYLGISAQPKGWYLDQVKNGKYSFPVVSCETVQGNLPNILGLAELYLGKYTGFINWSYLKNITFDFSTDKLIMNDEDAYPISIPRNMSFINLFKTSFYCCDLDVFLGDKSLGKVPVIFDTGMSISIHYGLTGVADSPNDLVLKYNGKSMFNISDSDRMELPEENVDDKWRGKPYIIVSNIAMIRPNATNSYKLSFTKDTINIKPKTKGPSLLMIQQGKDRMKTLTVKDLKNRYAS